jgi:uncharacterized protein involved in outer membrane biogenesis
MRSPRTLVISVAALLTTLLVALLVVPFVFRDRIASRLKAEIGSSVNARVEWGGAGLSLLRDFPSVTLSVDRFSVAGVKPFEGDTLASVAHARLVLDVGSVIRYLRAGDRIVVREIELRQPVVHLRVLENGTANWDIARTRPSATADTATAVAVTLRDFRIRGGVVTLDDRQSHLTMSVTGLDQSLRGDFARDRFVLASRTHADTVSLRFAGIPYLHRVGLELNADVAADLPAHRFTFTNSAIRLNNLLVALAGSVTMGKPHLALDLTFSTPRTAFRDILSLVPAIYARDFAQLQTAGTMSVSGWVRGAYGAHAFPALALRARVDKGAFRYPSLPLPARDISMDLVIDNPGGHVDSTVIDLRRLHAVIGNEPLDAGLVMRTPVSDPNVDLRLTGTVNLADVGRTVKLQGMKELSGVVAADVAVRARMSDMDAGRYDRVATRGTIGVTRLALRSGALPHPLSIDTAALRLTPRTAELTSFSGRIGRSDVRATGSLDNLLGFALRDQELRGSATVSSGHFDLNEWQSKEKTTEVIAVPPRVDFALKASAARVTYGALTLANVRGNLHVKDRRVTLEDLRMETLRGVVVANGSYETTVATRPTFDVDLGLTSVDIPAAFAALTTVQRLAPVARWAQGSVSGTFKLKGAVGQNMMPKFDALTGQGAFETQRLVIQGAPVLEKLAEALSLAAIRNPAFGTVRAAFAVADGRLHVKPFTVNMNGMNMTVAGSNGIDQSLNYNLALAVPHALLGGAAGRAVSGLASQAGKAGIDLNAAESVQLSARVTGTLTKPTIRPSFAGVGGSVRGAAQQVVATRVAGVKEKADSAAEETRRHARAEADRVVGEAERKAATIRAEARTLAATARREGNVRADSLQAQATNPIAKIAAQVAADRLRQEADQQAERIVREADARAEGIVVQAKRQANTLARPGA